MGDFISLNKQIHIYSVDTSAFYYENEKKIHNQLNKMYSTRNEVKNRKKKLKVKDNEYKEKMNKLNRQYKNANRIIKKLKDKLCNKFKQNEGKLRHLDTAYLNKYNIISVFESSLTRIIGIPINELSEDIIIVQTYFFDVIKDIIINGFMYRDEKYIFFTASAGQIRTKKTVFIKESVYKKYENTITCGLSIDKINECGGVNINKYLAYLALTNSATDLWEDFDINKAIVVDDFETKVMAKVDFIDDKTYEIETKDMEVPITHTDGCGMILPCKSKKNENG